jgi:hypothetical protein
MIRTGGITWERVVLLARSLIDAPSLDEGSAVQLVRLILAFDGTLEQAKQQRLEKLGRDKSSLRRQSGIFPVYRRPAVAATRKKTA